MQRGSMGGRERGSTAGPSRTSNRTSSGAPHPDYATPKTRTLAGTSTSGQKSYLPRLAAGGSGKKSTARPSSSSTGPALSGRPRRRSSTSTDNVALRSRPSLATGGPSATNRMSAVGGGSSMGNRLSTMGGAAGGGSSMGNRLSTMGGGGSSMGNRLSTMGGGGSSMGNRQSVVGGGPHSSLARTTPARSSLLPPSSTQSKRMSCESRHSTSGRRKGKEVRPITEAPFKKSCVDNIHSFLIDNGYCGENTNVLNRRIVTNPTTKDFTTIFAFIYNKLDINYKLPARFDEDIPRLLKQLAYPVQIPKSTFITVGSPHSWPTLLAMLSWLCDIVNDVMSTETQELVFPTDFETAHNRHWEDLHAFMDINAYPDEEYQMEKLEIFKEDLKEKAGVDNRKMREADDEQAELESRKLQLEQMLNSLDSHHHLNTGFKGDIIKLEAYNKSLEDGVQQLQDKVCQLKPELESIEPRKAKLVEEIAWLKEQKVKQSFTAPQLLSIKNHAKTSAATLQQLQHQTKQLQEKIWAIEMKQCRLQVTLAEHIQRYNTSPVAATTVGTIGHSHQEGEPSALDSSANESSLGKAARGLAARPQEQDLKQLLDRLEEERKLVRARVMEAHTLRSKADEECRHHEQQAEEKKHKLTKMVLLIKDTEEDSTFTKQEIESEEAAMVQQYRSYQAEVSALRRAPKHELYTKQQQLSARKEEMEAKKLQVTRRAADIASSTSRMCLAVNDALQYEEQVAQQLRQHMGLPTTGTAATGPLRDASNTSLAADEGGRSKGLAKRSHSPGSDQRVQADICDKENAQR